MFLIPQQRILVRRCCYSAEGDSNHLWNTNNAVLNFQNLQSGHVINIRHGKVVSAWRVRRNIAGQDQWSLLDKRDPMKGQHYYPIQDPSMTLVYGDQLAYRCTMVNLGKQSLIRIFLYLP